MEHDKKIRQLFIACIEGEGISLSERQISQFISYFEELCSWNEKINLTSLGEPTEIVVNLFIDSLVGRFVIESSAEKSIVDIGSGAGFPGVPLAISFPQCHITLVEPKLKKTAFLHHIIGRMDLDNVDVESQTLQELVSREPQNRQYDYIFAKAIRPESIFPSVLSLLHSQSLVGLYRSKGLGQEDSYIGMRLDHEVSYDLPFGYGSRVLSVLKPVNHGREKGVPRGTIPPISGKS